MQRTHESSMLTETPQQPVLLDRFGRFHSYLRISVTDRCNLRCLYCMPEEGMVFKPREDLLTYEEIERTARVFVGLGVKKIRITGGEPFVRRDFPVLLERLAKLEGLETLAVTTNGILLADYAPLLKAIGVTALNISLDTFRRERFITLARRDLLNQVLSGIEVALSVEFPMLKLNMVVMAGFNDDELLDFVDFARDKPINVRFIEFMPFKHNNWSPNGVVPYARMRELVESRYRLQPLKAEPSAVAKDFQLVGYRGQVSFITSMTDSFCATCNRIRLTADGNIKSCLFQEDEIPLRDKLRQGIDDEAIASLIAQAVRIKQEAHQPMEQLPQVDNRPMIAIGG